MKSLETPATELLGSPLKNLRRLSGGNLSEIIRFEDENGRILVAKNGPAPESEAEMLCALGAAGAPVPVVVRSSPDVLVMSWAGESSNMNWAALAAVLCGLHAKVGQQFGWHRDYGFGPMVIRNTPGQNWPDFWGNCRLAPRLPQLPSVFARRLETLLQDLHNRLPQQPKASLLHGDLWSGNIVSGPDSGCTLIDPACYYGDAEVDLAMLQVFDQPPHMFFTTYGALLQGAELRLPIYQLWPALVHYRLFGNRYLTLLDSLLSSIGV